MVGLLTLYSNHQDQVKRLHGLLELPVRAEDRPKLAANRKRHFTVSERVDLVAQYLAGATVYDLAAVFGIHRNRVARVLEEAGVQRRYHQKVTVDLDRAAVLEHEGLTLQQVADRLGIGRTALVVARRKSRESTSTIDL